MKKILPIRAPFYLGLSLLFLSAWFRLEHWPYYIPMFWTGFGCEVLFFILVFVEMSMSKKASGTTKSFWLLAFAAVLIACFFIIPEFSVLVFAFLGFIYLLLGRRYFLYTKQEVDSIRFDSI